MHFAPTIEIAALLPSSYCFILNGRPAASAGGLVSLTNLTLPAGYWHSSTSVSQETASFTQTLLGKKIRKVNTINLPCGMANYHINSCHVVIRPLIKRGRPPNVLRPALKSLKTIYNVDLPREAFWEPTQSLYDPMLWSLGKE